MKNRFLIILHTKILRNFTCFWRYYLWYLYEILHKYQEHLKVFSPIVFLPYRSGEACLHQWPKKLTMPCTFRPSKSYRSEDRCHTKRHTLVLQVGDCFQVCFPRHTKPPLLTSVKLEKGREKRWIEAGTFFAFNHIGPDDDGLKGFF